MKKPNFEDNEPNYFEEEDYDDKGDPFLDFFKDTKLKKPAIDKEPPNELLLPSKTNLSSIPRNKSFEDQKPEKKTFEYNYFC